MAKTRRIEGPTPNGGVVMEVFFLDEKRELVDEKAALHFEIVEYNKAGEQIFRTYGEFEREEETTE